MSDKLSDIRGMDAESEKKLLEAKINNTDELVEAALDFQKRAALAKQLGIDPKQLTEFVNRADLMRLKLLGKEFANLLEECGVDSCKELQHRVPANLYAKLKEVNDAKKITHHAPSLQQVEGWVVQAKAMFEQK